MQFVQADVRSIDLAAKRVHCTRGLRPVRSTSTDDHLSCSPWVRRPTFSGLQGVAENAVTLKTLGDAALLRARILAILEMASSRARRSDPQADADVRRRWRWLPPSVETIEAINDLVQRSYPLLPAARATEARVAS